MKGKVLILFTIHKEIETQTGALFSEKRNSYRPHQFCFRD
jgi:hypothetical protein